MTSSSPSDYAGKRIFDLVLASIVIILTFPVVVVVSAMMFAKNDRPIAYISERMKTVHQGFDLIKFRTMRPVTEGQSDGGVSGGDKSARITKIGKLLRDKRLDELPQLINVIRGDISLVGPRPPLRIYTVLFPETYEEVLRSTPGVTGLASLVIHKFEERVLSEANTAEETHELYVTRCIPRKAKVDLIYQRRASVRTDLYILYLTAAKLVPLPGRRAKRMRGR